MKQLTERVNDNDHISGNTDAPLELVEYGDYECPHCGRAYPMVKDIQQQLGSTIKLIFRNFPLSKIHPHAFSAAVAAEAAGLQGKFWEMHDILFENQTVLDTENIFRFASMLGLDVERFKNDIQQNHWVEKVEKDFESGLKSGVNGTPTFFVNGKRFDGEWTNGKLLDYLKSILANGLKILAMHNDNGQTFIEQLRCQIKEEEHKYRNALNSNKEFWELKLIKNNIQKLQTALEQIMNNLRNFMPNKA